MSQSLFSLGGFLVGGGAVYAYAKATGQEIQWRRLSIIRYAQRALYGTPVRSH